MEEELKQQSEEMTEEDFKNHQNPDLIILHKEGNKTNNIGRIVKPKIEQDEKR